MAVEEAKEVAAQGTGLIKSGFNFAVKATMVVGGVAVLGAGATAAIAADPSATLLSTAWHTAGHSLGGAIGGIPELAQTTANSAEALSEIIQSFQPETA